MEVAQPVVLGCRRVVDRRVVADQHELGALQPEHPVGLGPTTVVADRHAHDAAERAPHLEAFWPDLEVALLEMLERAPRLVLVVTGQMHLPVAADLTPVAAHEDLRVVAVPLGRLLREAEAEPDAEARRFVEQRLRVDRRHLGLEPRVDARPRPRRTIVGRTSSARARGRRRARRRDRARRATAPACARRRRRASGRAAPVPSARLRR